MVFPISLYGEPILRQQCKDISFRGNLDLETFLKNMFDTMDKAEGIGLAAPQIGFNYRIFVVNGKPLEIDELKNFRQAFINPKIIEELGKNWLYKEGCLSLPNINANISRRSLVKIHYFDQAGEVHTEIFDGMKARIIQHEYDHIEGKLFIDYCSAEQKNMFRTKLNSILKGKVKINYPIKVKGRIIK